MKKITALTLITVLMLILSACSNDDASESSDDKLKIYTTVFPLTSFAKEIGGDTVDVESIYPNGVDVHSYEPTQKDMTEYADGDLFIYTADELDPVAEKIKGAIGEDTYFLSAADNLSEDELLEDEHHHGEDGDDHEGHEHSESGDPHVWLDPVMSKTMAETVKDQLIEMNPEEEALYTENFNELADSLDDIDQSLKETTDNAARDTVYISHESIGYLAERYHFNQVGISGMNNEEPSQHQLTEMIDNIEKQDVSFILYEQNIPSRIAETIQQETGTEMLPFHNLSVLSEEDDQNATYQSLMEQNIDSLEKALN
jgi:zinc transport system substrate-binding protein